MLPNPPYPGASFRFCPRCAAEGLELAPLGRHCRCPACRFQFFFNPATAMAAFVFHQDKLILGVRAREPRQGALDLPGGFLDFEETVEEGLKREIVEELGIETVDHRYLTSAPNDYVYDGVLYKTADLFFICRAPDISGIRASDDVADFVLIAPSDVDPSAFAFQSSRRAFPLLLSALG